MTTNATEGTVERSVSRKRESSRSRNATHLAPTDVAALPPEIRESLWLDEIRKGSGIQRIARREKLGRRVIEQGVARARLQELVKSQPRGTADVAIGPKPDHKGMPRLVPLFPIGPFTPSSTCGHRHPIRAGSVFCCMVCHSSGVDSHPGLKRDPRTDPTLEPAEPRPAKGPPSGTHTRQMAEPDAAETRKQRRGRRFSPPPTTAGRIERP